MEIDLNKILTGRMAPWKRRLIPPGVIGGLEKIVHQDELNALLRAAAPAVGSEFASDILRELNISISIEGLENIPENGRFIFASNHPLGGLDGIALIKVLGEKYGDDNIRFPVNDMLLHVEPLRNVFLAINKYGSQSRAATIALNEAYASDCQICIFPAGLVSRLHDDGKIRDLEWHKSFVSKAIEYNRDIIPVRFIGQNSMRFYRTARLRKQLGVKVNIEQALLPSELCKSRNKHFRIIFGQPIDPKQLKAAGMTLQQIANHISQLSSALSS